MLPYDDPMHQAFERQIGGEQAAELRNVPFAASEIEQLVPLDLRALQLEGFVERAVGGPHRQIGFEHDQGLLERVDTSNRGFASMDEEKRREIARKGGHESGGNFANDPERAAEAGRKGGQQSGGNFANDRERAAEAGSKGGQSRG